MAFDMSGIIGPDGRSAVPWLTSDPRVPTPDRPDRPDRPVRPVRPMLPLVEEAAAPAAAGPQQGVARPGAAALRDTRDAWVDGVRSGVRRHPLASAAAALALGAVIARLAR